MNTPPGYRTSFETPSDYGRLRLRRLSEVRSRSVKFVVPGLIPLRSLTLLAGVGGLGKSTWAAAVAARETRGEYDGEPHDVLYVSYEDTAEEIWRPRMLAANGDPERVIEVHVDLDVGGAVVLPEDLDSLERVIRDHGVRLAIFDPLIPAIDLKLDTFKDQHVRSVLGKLRKVAEDTDSAVLGVGHLNKDPSTEAYIRIANSVAFWNASRSVVLVTKEDDDHRLISQVKANWSKGALVQRWRLEPVVLPGEIDPTTGSPVETSTLVYAGTAEDVDAHNVLQRNDGAAEELTRAVIFVLGVLNDGDWHESAEVKADATAAGFSERTLKRAAKEVGVEYDKRGFPMKTWWRLPPDRARPAPQLPGPTVEAAPEKSLQAVAATVGPDGGGSPTVAQPRSGHAPPSVGPTGNGVPALGSPELLPWVRDRYRNGDLPHDQMLELVQMQSGALAARVRRALESPTAGTHKED